MKTCVNAKGERISNSWFSSNNTMLQCPYPGCTHQGEVITKAHCRNNHNMEREAVKKKYGMPVIVDKVAYYASGKVDHKRMYSTSNSQVVYFGKRGGLY